MNLLTFLTNKERTEKMKRTYFDRFDIVNAYHAYCSEYYDGMNSKEYRILSRVKRLGRNFANSFSELDTENSRLIYSELCTQVEAKEYAEQIETEFKELLDTYEFNILSYKYYGSELIDIDPAVYRQELLAHADYLIREGIYPECSADYL